MRKKRIKTNFVIRIVCGLLLAISVSLTGNAASDGPPPALTVENPYATVDWEEVEQHKGNLHTHTTRSDGRMKPRNVIDRYYALAYSVLTLTDHNKVTYPRQKLKKLPSDMVAIKGEELSNHHHMGSYFNDQNNTDSVEASLNAIAEGNGQAMLFHPGRYNKSLSWYLELYRRHDHLVGLEVYNQGDRYKNDRKLWDKILTELMPDRPVWGYSNDDAHTRNHLGRNWTVFLLPELTKKNVRRAMKNGHSYFVYAPEGHDGPTPPLIHDVQVNQKEEIHIKASEYKHIIWISDGREIHRGSRIPLDDTEKIGSYLRAELHGAKGSVTGTQPFGIRRTGKAD